MHPKRSRYNSCAKGAQTRLEYRTKKLNGQHNTCLQLECRSQRNRPRRRHTFIARSADTPPRIECYFSWGERPHDKICRGHQKSKSRPGHSRSATTYQRGNIATKCACAFKPKHPHRLRWTDHQPVKTPCTNSP